MVASDQRSSGESEQARAKSLEFRIKSDRYAIKNSFTKRSDWKKPQISKECLGRVVRTSSTTHSDALHESSECLLIGVRKHPDGGCEAFKRRLQGIETRDGRHLRRYSIVLLPSALTLSSNEKKLWIIWSLWFFLYFCSANPWKQVLTDMCWAHECLPASLVDGHVVQVTFHVL